MGRPRTIDLAKQAKQTFGGHFSSDNYSTSAQSVLVPLDIFYTLFARYDRLIERDLLDADGIAVDSQGVVIDYTSTHPIAAAVISLLFATGAIVNTYFHLNYLKKIKENGSTHYIKEQLDAAIKEEQRQEPLKYVHDINYYLKKVISDNPDLQKKYENARIDGTKFIINYNEPTSAKSEPELQVVHHAGAQGAQSETEVKAPTSGFSFSRSLAPLWEALNLTAFTYWIMWIASGLITGQLGVGIAGMSPWVAFGVPIAVGLTYPIVKTYNYFKNRNKKVATVTEDDNDDPKVTKDGHELLRRALLRREFELEKDKLQTELDAYKLVDEPEAAVTAANNATISKLDQQILSLGKGKWGKTAVTLIATLGGTYVALQYGAWVVTDLLNTIANVTIGIPVVQLVLGTAMMAAAGIYGIYKAVERFYHVKDQDKKLSAIEQQQLAINTLEQRLEVLQKNNAQLENKLGIPPGTKLPHYDEDQFFADVNRRGNKRWTNFKKFCTRAMYFVNGALSGIFLARLFIVKGTAIALPFVAASLSNPITMGILVGVGILYGAFKVYEYHQQRKEERAKTLLAQREERIECLKQEVIVAGMREKLYKATVSEKEAAPTMIIPAPAQGLPSMAKVIDTTLFGQRDNTPPEPRDASPQIDLTTVSSPQNKGAA